MKKILNQNYDGTELCPYCGMESDFIINPFKGITFKCSNCGEEMIPCSLCDMPYGCTGGCDNKFCKKSICKTLIDYNEV